MRTGRGSFSPFIFPFAWDSHKMKSWKQCQVEKPDQTRHKLELTLAFHNLKLSHWKLSIYLKAFFFFLVVVVSAGPGTCYMHIYIDSRILYYWVTLPDLASRVHRKKELLSFGLLVSASQTWGKFIYFWKCQVTLGILPSPDSQLSADYLTQTR